MALFVSDGAGTGLDADFSITGFNITQNLEEAMTVSVKAKPTASTRAPTWVTGTGGGNEPEGIGDARTSPEATPARLLVLRSLGEGG